MISKIEQVASSCFELEDCLNEINSLKKRLNQSGDKSLETNLLKLNEIKHEINSRADELIKMIQMKHLDLLNETYQIEKYLKKKYFNNKLDTEIELKKIELKLNADNIGSMNLKTIKDEYELLKPKLIDQINRIESNEDEFIIKINLNKIEFGEILNKNTGEQFNLNDYQEESCTSTTNDLNDIIDNDGSSYQTERSDNTDKSLDTKNEKDLNYLISQCLTTMNKKSYCEAIKYCNKSNYQKKH